MFLILDGDHTIFSTKGIFFWGGGSQLFSEIAKTYGFEPNNVDNGGASRGRSVVFAVAVGCWHFNGNSMSLQ